MKFFERNFRKLNNKGLSLVELVCGIAILSIISITVAGVMIVSANSYSQGSAEAEVQQEAQLVANQISDLLIDATADVAYDATTEKLTIVQGDKRYFVEREDSTKRLFFTEEQIDGLGNVYPGTTNRQLMAEGVEKFEVPDVNNAEFAKTGYTRLNIQFENDGQTYNANYGITSRNKDTGNGTGVPASIILPTEVTLEPHQTYDFDASVQGLVNQNVEWEIENASDPELSGTSINDDGMITIGKDTTANIVRVHCKTEAMVGLNPAAESWVNVYVRRVNSLVINDVQCIAGMDGQVGAKYRLHAQVDGNNLGQVPGVEYDNNTNYKDPYVVSWSEGIYPGYTITKDPSDYEYAYLELTAGATPGTDITVTATAAHPNGSNKKGMYYATVKDDWTLTVNLNGGSLGSGWLRRTDAPQMLLDRGVIDTIKATYPDDVKNNIQERVRFKFREVTGEPSPGVYTYGDYYPASVATTGWIWNTNAFCSDADGSATVNLRPNLTGCWDYNKAYEVRIEHVLVDKTKSESDPGYILSITSWVQNVVQPVAAVFDSTLLGIDDGVALPESANKKVKFKRDTQCTLLEMTTISGLEMDDIQNDVKFTIEVWNGSAWESIPNGYIEAQNSQGKLMFTMRNDTFDGKKFKVTVALANQPSSTINVQNGTIDFNNPSTMTYNLDSNVFVFTAQKE